MIEWHQHKGDVHGGHRNYKSQKTNGKLKKGWMKMKAKKLLALGFAAIMMVSAMALPASAAEIQPMNNHDDTSFAFSFNNLGRSNTTGRAKQDDTGTYINAYTMCNGGFDVYVDGYNTNTGNWVDCTDKATRGQPHMRTTYNPGLISQ